MSLRSQILLGYGLVIALAAGVVAFALVNVARLGDASAAILSENYRTIEAAESLAGALERQDSAVLLAVTQAGGASARQFADGDAQFRRALAVARGNVTVPGEAAAIDSVETTYSAYASAVAEAPVTDARYRDRLFPAFQQATQAVAGLRDLNERAMVAASDRAGRVARRAVVSVGAIAALTLALGVALSLLLAGRITRPARRLRDAAARVAAGDLDVAVPPGRADELGALAATFNDMTDRLRAYHALDVDRLVAEQRKGAAVIESVDDGLVVVRADGAVDRMNPAAAVALGADAEAAIGRPLREVAEERPESGMTHLEALVRAALDGVAAPESMFMDSPDGARHYEPVASAVRTPDGALVGAVLVLRDVTGLRELDRLKSAFVATASHELKTPLTSMGMSVALLQEKTADRLTPREAELLEAAREDVERLTGLVRDLLDLSRLDAGLELVLAEAPVSGLVEAAVRGVRVPASDAGINLSADFPADLPAVRADARQVAHVLTNLLANAVRFTPRGGHIRVTARRTGGFVEIAVADDGEGVPLDVQGRIFERFVQAPGEKASGGSGLGLAIAREVVEAHGGTIRVESAPGMGATFSFTLPAA